MKHSTDNPGDGADRLEQFVDGVLRDQPLLRAPQELEQRVLAQIALRNSLPWWRKSFSHWPGPARLAFLVVCAALVGAAFQAAGWVIAPIGSAARTLHVPPEITLVRTVFTALSTVVHSVPSVWIYGGMAVLAILYATLFGIGAAAYRTIHALR